LEYPLFRADRIGVEMENDSLRIELQKYEALVLFELVSRFTHDDQLTIEHDAERRVLWSLCADLEKRLPEPFSDNYAAILEEARNNVISS
jgi:hypothetical protein